MVNGIEVNGVASATVGRNNHLAADTFSVGLTLDNLPGGTGIPQWAQADNIDVNLAMTQDSGGPSSVIAGFADEVTMSMANRTLLLAGRDYTALFIEALTAEKFQNLTSSQVVEVLAARQGLNSKVTPTTVLTGKYYDQDHAIVTNEVTEWALLSNLAQREGFDIFVEGRTLYFQPAPNEASTTPYDIFCAPPNGRTTSNVSRLILRRNQMLANDVVVKVISWNHEHKAAITSIRRAKKLNSPMSDSANRACNYTFREAGLSQSQADAAALSRLTELAQHERVIEFDMPADLSLTPRSLIRISGTGTAFDQSYFVSQIHIDCNQKKGFLMRVTAKNASPYQVSNL